MFPQYNPEEIEKRVRINWQTEQIESKARELSKTKTKKFFFMDGPPYASGAIHLGTAWNKILKDAYIRFFRMKGFDVWDQPGYDTHGTPIEVKVEKELGFNSKKDIENFGMQKFIEKCREFATKHISNMNEEFSELGVWMDWSNPYLTLNNLYIEGAWYTFKKAFEKSLLYKDKYPVHICSRCETVVSYNEIEHKTLKDDSVYVKFKIKGEENKFFVIWTTTPWTLPANTGIMVNPNYDYSFLKIGNEEYVIAKEIAKDFTEKLETELNIVKTVKGKELEGMEYDHPLKDIVDALKNLVDGHKVITSARYVNLESGTGLVHSAPGHGKEDYLVSKEFNSPMISFVGTDGKYTKDAGKWLAGKYVRDANVDIIKKLHEIGVLVKKQSIKHEYPVCWRCETPLLQLAVKQWFFKVTEIKDKLLKGNEKVNWNPKWAKERFNNWLENLGDWPVSRQRYWGIPLPIWECECGEIDVIGSYKELSKKSGIGSEMDFHRPFIDEVEITCKCKKKMKRIPDVLDVWFDAGVGTWASLNYPRFEDAFKEWWPTDLQIEGTDQFRGWWNAQIITSILTFDKVPFKNIIVHGMVMDAKGIKMSKSKGNIVSPEEVVHKHGRDPMRFYLLSSEPWKDFYWNWEELKEYTRALNILWNVYNFVKAYRTENDKVMDIKFITRYKNKMKVEDKWVLSKLHSLIKKQEKIESYNMHDFVSSVKNFILNDFSRWYIKLIRDRTSHFYDGEDKEAAQYVMGYVLEHLTRMLSPITPHIADAIYIDLFNNQESVHFENFPEYIEEFADKELEEDMEKVQDIVEAVNNIRSEKKIKARWPIDAVTLELSENLRTKELDEVIQTMSNVKKVIYNKTEGKEFKFGNVSLGEPVMEEGFVRELVRKIQSLRKEQKLNVEEPIDLYLEPSKKDEELIKKFEKEILVGVGSKSLDTGLLKKSHGELDFEGRKVKIYFEKV